MLILSRKSGESIVINGCIHVKIIRVEGDHVKVGVVAPTNVPVHRQEVYEEIQRNNEQALTRSTTLPKLPLRRKIEPAPTAASTGTGHPPSP